MRMVALFFVVSLGSICSPAQKSTETANPPKPASKATYLVLYRPGPGWLTGKSIMEQPLKEHGKYMLSLYIKNSMKLAGPLTDNAGGAVLLEVANDAEAKAIVANDPAVKSGVFVYEMHSWKLRPWDELARVRIPAGDTPHKQESATPFMAPLNDLKWIEMPERKGMQFAILSGDPKNGPYTEIRKVSSGTDNGLHSHSSEIKNVIISGVWYTGPDAASAKDFGPGSVVVMPSNWIHVSGCRAGSDCIFYQEGKDKFDFKPAADQPRK